MFFGLGLEVQSCRKSKNDQSLFGFDSCLTAVTANIWNKQKCLKTQGRTCFFDFSMKYKVVGNQKIIRVC